MNKKMMQTALISGANRGIGFEMARQLLKKGFYVFVSGRDEVKLSQAMVQLKAQADQLDRVDMILMDVSKFDSVKAAATILKASNLQLNVLINNAAILLQEDRSLTQDNDEVLKTTINTNCDGPMRVIHAFLPLIKNPGRIINLSSGGGSMSEPVGGWAPAYFVSKTMLNAMTRHLAFELSGKGIAVNAVSLGWVRTLMGGASATYPVEKGAETPVWLASEAPQACTEFFRNKSEIKW